MSALQILDKDFKVNQAINNANKGFVIIRFVDTDQVEIEIGRETERERATMLDVKTSDGIFKVGRANNNAKKDFVINRERERATMPDVKTLDRAFTVDRAINNAKKGFVIIRFLDIGHEYYKQIDQWIARYSRMLSYFAEIYMVEKGDVPEHAARYSLYDPDMILFFYRGRALHRLSTADIKSHLQLGKDFFDTTYDIIGPKLQLTRK